MKITTIFMALCLYGASESQAFERITTTSVDRAQNTRAQPSANNNVTPPSIHDLPYPFDINVHPIIDPDDPFYHYKEGRPFHPHPKPNAHAPSFKDFSNIIKILSCCGVFALASTKFMQVVHWIEDYFKQSTGKKVQGNFLEEGKNFIVVKENTE